MLWIHNTLAEMFDYYRFWNDRTIEAIFEINRGYVTILGLYASEEGRSEEADKFINNYKT
jgi:hypothetical protein